VFGRLLIRISAQSYFRFRPTSAPRGQVQCPTTELGSQPIIVIEHAAQPLLALNRPSLFEVDHQCPDHGAGKSSYDLEGLLRVRTGFFSHPQLRHGCMMVLVELWVKGWWRSEDRCVLRGKPDTDSDSFRTLNPIQIGHRFRSKSDSDSDLKSDTFPGVRKGVRNGSDYSQEELERRWISRQRWPFFRTRKAADGTTTQIHASD